MTTRLQLAPRRRRPLDPTPARRRGHQLLDLQSVLIETTPGAAARPVAGERHRADGAVVQAAGAVPGRAAPGRCRSPWSTDPATTTGPGPRASSTRARMARRRGAGGLRGDRASGAPGSPPAAGGLHRAERQRQPVAKQVRYWAAEVVSGDGTLVNEIDEVVWLDVAAASTRLSYDRDRTSSRPW